MGSCKVRDDKGIEARRVGLRMPCNYSMYGMRFYRATRGGKCKCYVTGWKRKAKEWKRFGFGQLAMGSVSEFARKKDR